MSMRTEAFSEDKDQRSPFKPPNDEEVFVTRETEKAKKKEAKEMLKSQKIWEKNTSTSRAPLRRVKDSDIPPADDYKDADGKEHKRPPAFSFTPGQNGLIQEAMQIARKRTQFPKDSRDLNMQEFIDQKKEMFHAELAYKNVQQEIATLENKKGERQAALQKSKQELEDDHSALMNFIQQDNKEKKDKENREKQANNERQGKEETIKKLDADIAAMRSEIDKHKDALQDLQSNQSFLLELTPQDYKDGLQSGLERKQQKSYVAWRQQLDRDDTQDDVIFGEDEEIHENIKLADISEETLQKHQTNFSAATRVSGQAPGGAVRRDKPRVVDRKNMTDQWLKLRFQQLMENNLVELPDDFYDDKLFFEDPDALEEKYNQLECDNLFYISRIQEQEQYLEDAKDKINKTTTSISGKVGTLEENKDILMSKIIEANGTLDQYKKHSSGSRIFDQNSVLHKAVKTGKKQQEGINVDDCLNQIKKKIGEIKKQDTAKEPIQLLYELETNAIKLVEQINVLRDDPLTRAKEAAAETLKFKDYATNKMTIKLALEDAQEAQKREMYQERSKKDVKHYGRVTFMRSDKPKVRKLTKVDEEPPQIKDVKTYLPDHAQDLLADPTVTQFIIDGK